MSDDLKANRRSMLTKSNLITAILVLAAFALDLAVPPTDPDAALAAQLLTETQDESWQRIELDGLPLFRGATRDVMFFETRGKQGPIRGAVVVQGDQIERLVLLDSREGLHQRELYAPSFLASFAGQPARPPLDVDGVSGATVSSQILLDAINRRLKRWRNVARPVDATTRPQTP